VSCVRTSSPLTFICIIIYSVHSYYSILRLLLYYYIWAASQHKYYDFRFWQIPSAHLARSMISRFLSVLFFRQAIMYCSNVFENDLLENCQFLQSCSTVHAAIYDWRYLYMVLLLLLLLLFFMLFYYYYYHYYFVISLWIWHRLQDTLVSWMHVHNYFIKLKMILWIKSDATCYKKLSFP
jgi:hypothetical protein